MSGLKFALPIIIGSIIDLFLGDPYSLPHPVRLIGTLISRLETIVRKHFSKNLRTGGIILSVTVLAVTSGTFFYFCFFSIKQNIGLELLWKA